MYSRLVSICFVFCVSLALHSRSLAAPLNEDVIAFDSKWILHIDMDAVRDSELCKKALKRALHKGQRRQKLQAVQKAIGLKSSQDVHGVTLYGTQFHPENGILLLHARLDRQKLESHLREKSEYQQSEYQGDTLHEWVEKKGQRGEHRVTAVLTKNELVVVGRRQENVKRAIDILDGRADSLGTRSDSALLQQIPNSAVPDGSIFLFRAVGLDSAEIGLKSPVARHAQFVTALLGDDQREIFARAQLKATSPETADKVRDLVEGFRAMLELRGESGEATREVAAALEVSAEEGLVTLQWRVAAERLEEAIQEMTRHKTQNAQ